MLLLQTKFSDYKYITLLSLRILRTSITLHEYLLVDMHASKLRKVALEIAAKLQV
jgi:hypothetical protein